MVRGAGRAGAAPRHVGSRRFRLPGREFGAPAGPARRLGSRGSAGSGPGPRAPPDEAWTVLRRPPRSTRACSSRSPRVPGRADPEPGAPSGSPTPGQGAGTAGRGSPGPARVSARGWASGCLHAGAQAAPARLCCRSETGRESDVRVAGIRPRSVAASPGATADAGRPDAGPPFARNAESSGSGTCPGPPPAAAGPTGEPRWCGGGVPGSDGAAGGWHVPPLAPRACG